MGHVGVTGARGSPGQDGLPGQPGVPGSPGKPVSLSVFPFYSVYPILTETLNITYKSKTTTENAFLPFFSNFILKLYNDIFTRSSKLLNI